MLKSRRLQHVPDGVLVEELRTIMPRLAPLLAQSVGADRCAIFVYDEHCRSTVSLFRHGYDVRTRAAHELTDLIDPWDIPAEAEVMRTRSPLQRQFPEDNKSWPLLNPGQEVIEGRIRDLVLPLIWNESVQGVAYVWRSGDPTPFSLEEMDSALKVSRMAAMAIVFARQYKHERASATRVGQLLDVATLASSGRGINAILPMLAGSISDATDADVCNLYVFDDNDETVVAAYEDGLCEEEREVFLHSIDPPVSDVPVEVRMRRTLMPEVVTNFERDLADGSAITEYALRAGIAEILIIPIVSQSRMIGVVYCWYRDPERSFSDASIDMAEAIASQAGGVITRAKLQESTDRQLREGEAILRIGQAVLQTESLELVLDEIAGALDQLISYDYACVGTLTRDKSGIKVIREWGDAFNLILNQEIPVAGSLSGTAVRTQEIVHSSNVQEDPRAWSDDPKSPPLRSIMVAPLVTERGTVGTLFVGRRESQDFTSGDTRLMALLSQQAAAAIERVQTRQALTNRAQRHSFLASVVDLLVGSDEPTEVLSDVADLACGVIADGVSIGLSSCEYGKLDWKAHAFNDSALQAILGESMQQLDDPVLVDQVEQLLHLDQERLFDQYHSTSANEFLGEVALRLDVRQLLVIPLQRQERARGLLVLLSRSDSPLFNDEDIELGRIVAQRIGDALERHQVRANQEALLRVSEALHGHAEIETLVHVLGTELEHILPCDQLYIGELDHEEWVLRPHLYRQRHQSSGGQGDMPADVGICGEVLRTRQPIMDNYANLRDATVYSNESERTFYHEHGESVLVAPLTAEDQLIGVLFISRAGYNRFTAADLETFLIFAGLAGAAFNRTSLLQHNQELYRASVEVLAAVVDAKDPTTLEHSRHVAYYSRLAAELMELSTDEVERIELAGLLHDIGKLSIPDHILRKSDTLTEEEFELIRAHPERGAGILERHPALADLVPLVRHHHEWFSGEGYPSGLSNHDIPLGASIIAVADAFDTMVSERTYQRRKPDSTALDELERCSGIQFHPEVVTRFVSALRADRTLKFGQR